MIYITHTPLKLNKSILKSINFSPFLTLHPIYIDFHFSIVNNDNCNTNFDTPMEVTNSLSHKFPIYFCLPFTENSKTCYFIIILNPKLLFFYFKDSINLNFTFIMIQCIKGLKVIKITFNSGTFKNLSSGFHRFLHSQKYWRYFYTNPVTQGNI